MNIKRGALQYSLLFGCALLTLPAALPANNTENTTNINTSSNKMLVNFFKNGASKSSVIFDEILPELEKYITAIKDLEQAALAAKREVQTVELIAVIITDFGQLPLDVQEAITTRHGKLEDKSLRESLEIFFNEAKALGLLEKQLGNNSSKRLPWRTLCDRTAALLNRHPDYKEFVGALIAAKDSLCVLFAKIRLKSHLAKLPRRLAEVAKAVDAANPGKSEVVTRIFWE